MGGIINSKIPRMLREPANLCLMRAEGRQIPIETEHVEGVCLLLISRNKYTWAELSFCLTAVQQCTVILSSFG